MGGKLADGLFGLGLRAQIGDGYVRTAFGQREGDGAADAFGRSCDEHGLSGQQLVPCRYWFGAFCAGGVVVEDAACLQASRPAAVWWGIGFLHTRFAGGGLA